MILHKNSYNHYNDVAKSCVLVGDCLQNVILGYKTKMRRLNNMTIMLVVLGILSLTIFSCRAIPLTRQDQPDEKPDPVTETLVSTEAPPESTSTQHPQIPTIPDLNLVTKIIDNRQDLPQAVFNRRFPELTGSKIDQVELFNLLIEETVEKEVLGFQDSIKDLQPIPELPNTESSFLSGYSVFTANQKLLSIKLQFATYVAGAAHPYSYARTINYDLNDGIILTLDDVFKPDSNYLEFLSDFCKKEILKRDIGLFDEGVLPTAENFRSWGLSRDGLWIEFDPYQVTAYAAGPQKIIIPYDQIDNLLNPTGPAFWQDAAEINVEAKEVPPAWPTETPLP